MFPPQKAWDTLSRTYAPSTCCIRKLPPSRKEKVNDAAARRGLRTVRGTANIDAAILAAGSHENVGCFSDFLEDRVLTDVLQRNDMTPDLCRTHCEGHSYYGTQVIWERRACGVLY